MARSKRERARIAYGLCIWCGNNAETGIQKCTACAQKECDTARRNRPAFRSLKSRRSPVRKQAIVADLARFHPVYAALADDEKAFMIEQADLWSPTFDVLLDKRRWEISELLNADEPRQAYFDATGTDIGFEGYMIAAIDGAREKKHERA